MRLRGRGALRRCGQWLMSRFLARVLILAYGLPPAWSPMDISIQEGAGQVSRLSLYQALSRLKLLFLSSGGAKKMLQNSWRHQCQQLKKFLFPQGVRSLALHQKSRMLKPVRWGNLRRITPFSRVFGFDRGLPVDRYYIESFLDQHRGDIRGRVLEIGDSEYTQKFGGAQVTHSEVLHAVPGNPQATLVGDLVTGRGIPAVNFDCLILTQTLFAIFELKGAISQCYEALKPGGVLLATLPGISQISRYDLERWGDYWRFTTCSAQKLFEERFQTENLSIQAWGNVLAAMSLLQGLAANELTKEELDYRDPDYQVIITVRAAKPGD